MQELQFGISDVKQHYLDIWIRSNYQAVLMYFLKSRKVSKITQEEGHTEEKYKHRVVHESQKSSICL